MEVDRFPEIFSDVGSFVLAQIYRARHTQFFQSHVPDYYPPMARNGEGSVTV